MWTTLLALSVCLLAPMAAMAQPSPLGVQRSGGGNQLFAVLRGEGFLEAQQPRLALQTFRGVLEARPNHLRAHLGMLRAMAVSGLCEGAEEAYDAIEGSVFDHAKARGALGTCMEKTGRLDAALELYGDAARLDPYEPRYRFARATLLVRMGRDAEAEAERVLLFGTERGLGFAFLADALALWERGDSNYLAALQQAGPFRFIDEVRRGISRLESAESMREECTSNPGVSYGLAMFDPDLGALSAECLRRTGDAEGARQRLERPAFRRTSGSYELAPVLARLHVDAGELHEAERVLAGQPDSIAGVMASRWYLARAQGDSEAMAVWAARYLDHPQHQVEPLEALVPLEGAGPEGP